MTKKEVNMYLAAVLETLAESERGEAPEGILYMALSSSGASYDDWQTIVELLLVGEVCEKIAGPQLRITAKGREVVESIAAARK